MHWAARAGYVYGWKKRHHLNEVIPATDTSPGESTTWNYEYVPWYTGVHVGVDAFGADDPVVALDVGLTTISPEYEATFAYAYDVTDGASGFRWRGVWCIPIGKRLFAFTLEGDHFFGDATLRTVFVGSFGFTSSIGVRATR
jgi:hypothetical protein